MKVSCGECGSSFKVKGEVPPGKAFKFKCPKCKHVNRLIAGEDGAQPAENVAIKVPCEDCGAEVLPPDEGPPLCDQCRASRAVEEARRKSLELMEEKDDEFPDEIFEGLDGRTPPPDKGKEAIDDAGDEMTQTMEFTVSEGDETLPPVAGEEKKEKKPVDLETAMYEVRSKDGLVIGPVKLNTLRDLIVAKKVKSDEECRRNDEDWVGMLELREIFEIFESEKVLPEKEKEIEERKKVQLSLSEEERAKLIEELKVKKKCEGCGAEIYILEDIAHPLCDQCRIDALIQKKKKSTGEKEPRYKVRSPDGLVLGPLKIDTLEDLAEAGNIQGHEEVSVDGGPWTKITDMDELAYLFEEEDGLIELTETVDG